MYIEARLYVFLVGAIILLLILITSLVISYLSTIKRLRKLEENEDDLYKKTIHEEKKIVEQAQKEWQTTIKAANNKASEIISEAIQINNDSQENLSQAVEEIAEKEKAEIADQSGKFLTQYTKELNEINSESIGIFKNISTEIVKTVDEHFNDLRKILSEQTVESKKLAEDKVRQEYDLLEKELASYKEKELKKVQDNIYQVLLNISKMTIGKGLSMQDHEELILNALDEAKKSLTTK